MNPLNASLALELMNDHAARAERYRQAHRRRERGPSPGYEAVTIRRTSPDDWRALERLAQLEGRTVPDGPALAAEVDERILAARWIRAEVTLADPFLPTAELVALLDTRARHLGARPRTVTRPLRRAVAALRRKPAALRH